MDCDLQDQPEEIIRLYHKAQEGYDVVFARRAVRKDTFLKKLSSRVFYAIYSYFTAGAFDSTICNFSISRRMVMDGYKRMGDQNRAFILFIKWMDLSPRRLTSTMTSGVQAGRPILSKNSSTWPWRLSRPNPTSR